MAADGDSSKPTHRLPNGSASTPVLELTSRHISPLEPWICQGLTKEIRRHFHGRADGGVEQETAGIGFDTPTLESAIRTATYILRYHAKWFAPADLADLITTITETRSTTSSVDLTAALRFFETVSTYAFIPIECLPHVARFVAQAYYNSSKARRTQQLVTRTWDVTTNIMGSHTGKLFFSAILQVLEDEATSKDGFTVVAGTLTLIVEILKRWPVKDLPLGWAADLTRQAHALVRRCKDDKVLLELVGDLYTCMLADENLVDIVSQDGWSEILEITFACCHPPISSAGYDLLRTLDGRASRIDKHLLIRFSDVELPVDLALTEMMWEEWITQGWPLMPDEQQLERLKRTMSRWFVCDLSEPQLAAVYRRNALATDMDNATNPIYVPVMAALYVSLLQRPNTPAANQRTLSKMLIQMFLARQSQPLFDALCSAATSSLHITQFLFSLRRDITHALYTRYPALSDYLTATGAAQLASALATNDWNTTILGAFRRQVADWEIFDHFLRETRYLISNHTFFAGQMSFIRELQTTVRGVIQSGSFPEPPPYTGLSKAYVTSQLVQLLLASLSYHRALSREEITDLVSLFNDTAGSRDYIVSIECIHALTICCYEVPEIMAKYMDDVIDKMARLVTQRYLAIHVLQFLSSLSRLPHLYHNFTTHDYKKIFAVCYNYLQTTRGVQTVVERKVTPSSERSSATPRDEEALPEYVYNLAHHVITFWYISLKQQYRDELKPYITSCLTYEVDEKPHVEDQGLVTIDMMDRLDAESQDELTRLHSSSAFGFDSWEGRITERNRLVGMLLINTQTSLRSGRSLVTIRRPSGTSYRLISADAKSRGSAKARATVEADANDHLAIVPEDKDGITYGSIAIPRSSWTLGSEEIITLPNDEAVTRAIQSFDRTSALDSHKAGVLYIGERQNTEDRVFQNISGSTDYREFINGLGQVERLKNATFYTQGLDHSDDTDGAHAIVWRYNDVTELIYHITTLMPNSADPHENTGRKKRHVGNDHVNIVFNNSGVPHDFNTLYNLFPGQFTFVYIVIAPSARTSFLQARTESGTNDKRDRFYSVQVFTRPDYPNVSPGAEEKVVSGASLPAFVRSLALNECIMSLMWTGTKSGEYPSSWRSRMEQLRRLGKRYGTKAASKEGTG